MSLDSLFQQVLLTEKHLADQTNEFKEAKIAIIRCQEQIKSTNEILEKTKEEHDKKAQQLSLMTVQHGLMKKQKKQMLVKNEELLGQKNHLQEHLAKIKRESTEEKETFLLEISRFNSDFSLTRNIEMESKNQTSSEILDLERKVELLHKEMEQINCRYSHMSTMQEQKRELQLELKSLEDLNKDLEQQLMEAEAMTESLKAESLFVSQKPLTDSTCLRLRKELEILREGELELRREALSSEIQFIKSNLDSSQGSGQQEI